MKMLTLWMMALANSKSHMHGDADANAKPTSILASGACTIYLCYYELLHIIGFHLENDLTGKTFPSIVHSGPAYRTYERTLRRIHLTSFVSK
jgi:hypothetical protein